MGKSCGCFAFINEISVLERIGSKPGGLRKETGEIEMRKPKLIVSSFVLMTAVFFGHPLAAGESVSDELATSDRWQNTLYFYLWTTGMDGTAAIGGNEADIDLSFSDLFEDLDGALSLRFESHKGKWGYFIDGMYVKLNPTQSTPLGTIDVTVKDFILEGGGVYHFNPKVQGLFGLRYQKMDMDISLPGPLPAASGDQDWVDAFAGVRVVPFQNDNWRLWLRGDIGGGSSDFTWNAVAGAEYQFNKNWSGVMAYRVLSTDYSNNGFKWDVDLSGLALAVGYTW